MNSNPRLPLPAAAFIRSSLPWDGVPQPGEAYALAEPAVALEPMPEGLALSAQAAALHALLLRYGGGVAVELWVADEQGAWRSAGGEASLQTRVSELEASLRAAVPEPAPRHAGGDVVLCAPRSQAAAALQQAQALQAAWVWLFDTAAAGGEIRCDGRRFEPDTVRRSAAHYLRLLAAWVAAPDMPIDAPTLLGDDELPAAARSGCPAPSAGLDSVIACLAQRAAVTPHALAYRHHGDAFDFAAVAAWSAGLAAALHAQQVRPGEPVGVFVERSHRSAIALLAVWQAQACYLPIDVEFPADYLAHIVRQNALRVAIADAAHAPRLAALGVQVIDADGARATPGAAQPLVLAPEAAPEQAAAIFYTSGSTGLPKGVVHSQAAVLNRLQALFVHRPLGADEQLAQRTPITFIPSMGELLGSVICGCTTTVIPQAAARDPDALAALIVAEGITRIGMVPSLLATFLGGSASRQAALAGLRGLSLAGEVLSAPMAASLRERFPQLQVTNDYGCTETNGVLLGSLTEWSPRRPQVPAGRPIANVQAQVLDPQLRSAPLNVVGDLYLSGVAVGAGYIDRPEETARKYLERRAGDGSVERLYATGDRARRLPDGQFEVLGRSDNVVKIRGNRVEIEGVEAVLARHPDIAQAAVSCDPSGHKLVAYVVAAPGAQPRAGSVRGHLDAHLPAYMVPARFVEVAALPRSIGGKLDRAGLRRSPPPGKPLPNGAARAAPAQQAHHDLAALLRGVTEALHAAAGSDPLRDEIDLDSDFRTCGLDSLGVVAMVERLNERFGAALTAMQAFDIVTPRRLAAHLAGAAPAAGAAHAAASEHAQPAPADADIAIIGLAGRFPGADSLQGFWSLLERGGCAVAEIPAQRWDWRASFQAGAPRHGRSYSRWAALLDDIARFDPLFFGLSVREARSMDPQQRLMLEAAWHAFEHAGYDEASLTGKTVGVFVGARPGDYHERLLEAGAELGGLALVGNDAAVISGRIAYHLDLHGPALSIDTACSSSLVALHVACQALRAGECEMALAGGVSLMTGPEQHVASSQAGMLSPTGRCATFSDQADGFVPGEGVGALVLKPLARALADGDRVWAVIKASAVNQDGKTNGITAPSGAAQRALLGQVYARPGLAPQSVQVFEAHGTGTRLGDPIEVQALADALGSAGDTSARWVLGSVKANIGHLIAAAGVAGVIKLVYAMNARRLPPSVHLGRPNPHIAFERLPFDLLTDAADWPAPAAGGPRRAGISSFGFSGTNAHVLLEEAPAAAAAAMPPQAVIVPLAAKSPAALRATAAAWAAWLESQPEAAVSDVAHTAQRRVNRFASRAAIVCASAAQLAEALRALAGGSEHDALQQTGRTLLPAAVCQPLGRQALDWLRRGDTDRSDALGLLATAFVAGFDPGWRTLGDGGRLLDLPGLAFLGERCWADQLAGAEPNAQPPAAPAAGVRGFTAPLAAAMPFFAEHRVGGRGVLPGAAQLTLLLGGLALPEAGKAVLLRRVDWLTPVFQPQASSAGTQAELRFDLAASSGGAPAAGRFELRSVGGEAMLHSRGEWLGVDAAAVAGSQRIDHGKVLARCQRRVTPDAYYHALEASGVALGAGFRRLRAYRYSDDEAIGWLDWTPGADHAYAAGALQPQQLDAVLHCAAGLAFVDGRAAAHVPCAIGEWAWTGEVPREALVHVRRRSARQAGTVHVDMLVSDLDGKVCMRVDDLTLRLMPPSTAPRPRDGGADKATLAWRAVQVEQPLARGAAAALRILLCGAAQDVRELTDAWPQLPGHVLLAQPDPAAGAIDWPALLQTLRPDVVVRADTSGAQTAHEAFGTLFGLAQACIARAGQPLPAVVLATAAQADPAQQAAAGFLRAWAAEYAQLRWRIVGLPGDAGDRADALAAEVGALRHAADCGLEVCYDDGRRFERRLSPFVLPAGAADAPALPEGGAVLITGGMGGAGRALARHLARRYRAGLVLVGRQAAGPAAAALLAELRTLGSEACYVQSDVCGRAGAQRALAIVRRRFGRIDGIFHCAGVIRDALLGAKTLDAAAQVLAPKIDAARWLDELSAADALSCFVLFSSISAEVGTVGQVDYGFANRWLDAMAAERDRAVRAGLRQGRTLAVDWPLLADGGMQPSAQVCDHLARTTGMVPMPAAEVCRVLDVLLAGELCQAFVMHGHAHKLSRLPIAPVHAGDAPAVRRDPSSLAE